MTKVIYIGASWCPPCKLMKPIIAELEKELPDIEWEKIDVDDDPDASEKYDVMSIPTFKIEVNGVKRTLTGAHSKELLRAALIA